MSKVVKIKKGLNIPIKGIAPKELKDMPDTSRFAIKPPDFRGLQLKLNVKQGEEVKAGGVVLFDKNNNDIVLVAPVSGTIIEVKRGERRRILEVVIETSDAGEVIKHDSNGIAVSRKDIVELLLKSGLWPYISMRPYGIVANPEDNPRDIFISTFDSSPLAADVNYAMAAQKDHFISGLKVLSKLTTGDIHLGINADDPGYFGDIEDVTKTSYKGPHPAGNVGIQIAQTKPLAKGDIVWTIAPQDVALIGKLFSTGEIDFTRIIALSGTEASNTGYYKTKVGASLFPLLNKKVSENKCRYISGNVLTGARIEKAGFLGFYNQEVTIIPEGDDYEFFGWAAPRFNQYSNHKAYFSWLMPGKKYEMNANLHGEERAFVVTGEYEKVFPMDVMPVHLLKSILIEDIDEMEKLGIFEVVEEDMALCEYVCTSKIEVQKILRKGIDLMIKETM